MKVLQKRAGLKHGLAIIATVLHLIAAAALAAANQRGQARHSANFFDTPEFSPDCKPPSNGNSGSRTGFPAVRARVCIRSVFMGGWHPIPGLNRRVYDGEIHA